MKMPRKIILIFSFLVATLVGFVNCATRQPLNEHAEAESALASAAEYPGAPECAPRSFIIAANALSKGRSLLNEPGSELKAPGLFIIATDKAEEAKQICTAILFDDEPKARAGYAIAFIPGMHLTSKGYLIEGKNEDEGFGLYSYILFSRYPVSEGERRKYVKLHEAFRKSFETVPGYDYYGLEKEYINLTYWLLKKVPSHIEENLEYVGDKFFIDNYDYPRAKKIKKLINGIGIVGPFIISSYEPLTSINPRSPKKDLFIIDLSNVHEKFFSNVLLSFDEKVCKDPTNWKRNYDWERLAVDFYSAIEKHGNLVLYAAKWWNDLYNAIAVDKQADP